VKHVSIISAHPDCNININKNACLFNKILANSIVFILNQFCKDINYELIIYERAHL